ncbi:3-dehydroquinate synthase [Hippea jasoniae]|uniref:3-dehydroquinate synthase n=1 Tax=Hippea jasoniae TaxID=944479 RepID=UPI00069248DF|nr:3-dehydroquinate synthase [Hippea jasoniae]
MSQRIIKIDVKTSKPYPVYINEGFDFIYENLKDRRCFFVTDSNLYRLYKSSVFEKFSTEVCVFEAGEESKNYKTLFEIYDFLLKNRADRSSYLVGVGGGVVGDIAGFAASSYMRGMGLIHIPTSLLAMVDSSIGGKTAINYGGYKNIIGSFYQPDAVFVDVNFLKTLPGREYFSAFAEVIKYGIIMDSDLFDYIEEHIKEIKNKETGVLRLIIEKSIKDKVEVVEDDEKESSRRAILNLGHTFAHAIESITDYKVYLHGEAVAIGILMALRLSLNKGLIEESTIGRVEALLKKLHLPTKIDSNISSERMFEIMLNDKKNRDMRLHFVLTRGIGSSIISQAIVKSEVIEAIDAQKAD